MYSAVLLLEVSEISRSFYLPIPNEGEQDPISFLLINVLHQSIIYNVIHLNMNLYEPLTCTLYLMIYIFITTG